MMCEQKVHLHSASSVPFMTSSMCNVSGGALLQKHGKG